MSFTLIIYMLFFILASYLLILLFIKQAPKLGLVDIPNQRSSHDKPIPRGAGIVFAGLFLVAITTQGMGSVVPNYYLLFALGLIYMVGIIDDLKSLKASTKLFVILLAAFLVYLGGYKIDSFGTYFGYEIHLGWFALPFTLFAVSAFTNAVNLTDGLDGLAGTLSITMLCTIFYIGFIHNDMMLIYWSAFLIAVLIGFLILNWYPAKVFMGDTGSLFLGFIIAVLALQAFKYVSPTSILFFAAIPILDTLIVFRRRIQRGKSPFSPDKNHMHHILFNAKQDKAFTVKMLIYMQVTFSLMFIQIHHQDDFLNLLTFVILFLVFFNLFDPRIRRRPKTSFVRKKYNKKKLQKKETQNV